ncbi:MAG: anthranilate synthase component I [Solibacterales bacterium]|nr:anthranilate synthase component I [Bryobacterales bacterium]|tara:strand:- start:3794 stop:5266 length:1473 start_codon:yes stop_codon:yes gene_type:complete
MSPDFETFKTLSTQGNLIPVHKVLSADLETPVSAYLKLSAKRKHSFLFESVEGGEKVGRYTFLGADPFLTVTARGRAVEIFRNGKTRRQRGNVFEILRDLVGEFHPVGTEGLPPFSAGAVGYASYDLIQLIEPRVPKFRKDDIKMPDAMFLFFATLLAFDHVKHEIHVIANVRCNECEKSLQEGYLDAQYRITQIEKTLAGPLPTPKKNLPSGPLEVQSNVGKEAHCRAVEKAKEYIRAGDIFQVVLSQRLEMEPGVDAFQIYRALRTVNPSPYLFYLHLDDTVILGSSPEMLVKVSNGEVHYRPIAGTRPRGTNESEDRTLAKDLLQDEKELAEHVMLVDLGRNDLGRVCEFSTVRVPEFKIIEYYSHVMHIVSSVQGKLKSGKDAFDALMSCFPAGTVSGAPKVRAMEIIAELERSSRGVYSGSVMYLDFSGNLDSCIAIRTMVVRGQKAYLQAGGGIVADSIPEREWEETMNKARALLNAVDIARES